MTPPKASLAALEEAGTPPDAAVGKPKLARKIAAQIGEQIIRDGWKVGAPLGNEASLVERYGVSRWAVREAIAIVERDGLVEMRRGRSGGLFVAAPAAGAISASIRNYLEFAQVSVDNVIDVRYTLEELALTQAAARITPQEVRSLRALADSARNASDEELTELGFSLLGGLLGAAHNIVLKVLIEGLAQLTIAAGLYSQLSDRDYLQTMRLLVQTRLEQTDAVIAGDSGRIHDLLRRHLATSERLLRETRIAQDSPITTHARERGIALMPKMVRGKRGEQLALEIQSDIVSSGWQTGRHLGSEGQLLARYKVSRSVFREAVRILEQHGVVEMRQGRHSGLKVSSPSPNLVIARAKIYFLYAGIGPDDVNDVLSALEISAVGLIAKLPEHALVGAALAAIAGPALPVEVGAVEGRIRAFYEVLTNRCPNPIAAIFMRMLSEMFVIQRFENTTHDSLRPILERIRRDQRAVAQGITDGDASAARRAIIQLRADALELAPKRKHAAQILEESSEAENGS